MTLECNNVTNFFFKGVFRIRKPHLITEQIIHAFTDHEQKAKNTDSSVFGDNPFGKHRSLSMWLNNHSETMKN